MARIVSPTLLVWGDRDRFLTRAAAEASARFVTGPYRFVARSGAGHWLPSESGTRSPHPSWSTWRPVGTEQAPARGRAMACP